MMARINKTSIVTEELDRVALWGQHRDGSKTSSPGDSQRKRLLLNVRRRLANRWKSRHLEADYVDYRQCCRFTTKVTIASQRDHYRQQLFCCEKVGDLQGTPPSADRDVTRTDEENQPLCNTFSDFFATKITKIKTTISARLTSLNSSNPTPDTPFTGSPL